MAETEASLLVASAATATMVWARVIALSWLLPFVLAHDGKAPSLSDLESGPRDRATEQASQVHPVTAAEAFQRANLMPPIHFTALGSEGEHQTATVAKGSKKVCTHQPCDDETSGRTISRTVKLRDSSGSAEESSGASGDSASSATSAEEEKRRLTYQFAPKTDGDKQGIEIDTAVAPYPNAGIEPFGQEEAAAEVTEDSIAQSNGMIDQIENAQAIEAKRAVFRALTKLRGATIASYDGIAKSHIKNVEDYAEAHKWRLEHPMRHLAEEEADVERWAFPNKPGPSTGSSGAGGGLLPNPAPPLNAR